METSKRSIVNYALAAWAVINVILMAMILLNGDAEDLNNYIEIALWTLSIPAVLSGKKWGIAFAIFTLVYTLSTSVGIIIYYQVWLNAIWVAINLPATIYLFKVLIKR